MHIKTMEQTNDQYLEECKYIPSERKEYEYKEEFDKYYKAFEGFSFDEYPEIKVMLGHTQVLDALVIEQFT